MKKCLNNTAKTQKYLASLPKIYLVACWAKYGVREYYFSGKYERNENGIDIPLVYHYDDCNGTCDNYWLRRINHTTTGSIVLWTQMKSVASKVAELFNKEMGYED